MTIYHEGWLIKARHLDQRVKGEIFSGVGESNDITAMTRMGSKCEFHAFIESGTVQTSKEKVLHQSVVKTHSAGSSDSSHQHLQLAMARIEQGVAVINSVEPCSIPWEL